MNKNISVVIVSYNSKDVITQCIKSVRDFCEEIIVVDNASIDDSVKTIKQFCKKVKIIENDKNIGYGRACNLGIKTASKEYVAIVNPDTTIKKDIFTPLIHNFIDDCVFMAAPICYRPNDNNKIRTANRYLNKCEATEIDRGVYDAKFISGAFFVINRAKWMKLGGFDENIFLFYEDDEVCKNALKNGYKLIIDKKISVKHESGTGCGNSQKVYAIKDWHTEWSRLYIHKKYKNRNIALWRFIRNVSSAIFNLLILRTSFVKKCIIRANANFSFLQNKSCFNPDGSGYLP